MSQRDSGTCFIDTKTTIFNVVAVTAGEVQPGETFTRENCFTTKLKFTQCYDCDHVL